MDPATINCIIAACCPPEARVHALQKWLTQFMPEGYALLAAQEVLKNFDLAPAGSLVPLVQAVAKLARGADYQE